MKSVWKMRRVRGRSFLALVFLWALFAATLTACSAGSGTAGKSESAREGIPAQAASTEGGQGGTEGVAPAEPGRFPVTVVDATGAEITVAKEPERIVSIIPSATETAFALGLGEKIVGVSAWDNYPEEVKKLEKVGGLDVNVEKVVSLQPDLVLAHVSNGKSVEALRKAGVKVLVTDAKSLAETFAAIRLIAQATGTQEEAEALIRKMQRERDEVIRAVADIPAEKRPKVWLEVSPELHTAGQGTFLHELVKLAGGQNVASDLQGWVQVNEEKVIAANPDVIFVTYGYYVQEAAEQVKQRKSWQVVNAVKNGRVYELHSDLVDRPGPRITQGLRQIASLLHPDKLKD
ncbi:ABC transporter substrate-binding protein [Bacillaceae bacterium]